jgi:hypothetical protein
MYFVITVIDTLTTITSYRWTSILICFVKEYIYSIGSSQPKKKLKNQDERKEKKEVKFLYSFLLVRVNIRHRLGISMLVQLRIILRIWVMTIVLGQQPNIFHFHNFCYTIYISIKLSQCTKIGHLIGGRLEIYVGFICIHH